LHTFCWKTWLEGLGKASLSVHTQADSGQYIHPTFFGFLLTASWVPCIYTVLVMSSKRKQNKPSILKYFRYQNKTNRIIPKRIWDPSRTNLRSSKFFVIETKRTILFPKFSGSKWNRPN
jgi:hypothetical protein